MPEEINFSFNFGGKTLKVKTENALEFGFEFSLLKSKVLSHLKLALILDIRN